MSSTDQHHRILNCLDDPNFATICSFLENFGETCHIGFIPFRQLQEMLENTTEVAPDLAQIHILLLRRIYKSINTDKWEKHLSKFCHSYNSQDAWELERFGYKKSKIQTKLRLLKNLMESQFDYNTKFKNEVNKLSADNLRRTPLGRDSEGQLYWYQVDAEANLRIYREDVDDDTWELVATNREEMNLLIQQLSNGIVHRNAPEDCENGAENGVGEGEASPREDILRDTGAVHGEGKSESDEEAMAIDEDYVESGENEDTEVKNAESDRMNTMEVGEAVRPMLDTSKSVNQAKTSEIKFGEKDARLFNTDTPNILAEEQPIVTDSIPPEVICSSSDLTSLNETPHDLLNMPKHEFQGQTVPLVERDPTDNAEMLAQPQRSPQLPDPIPSLKDDEAVEEIVQNLLRQEKDCIRDTSNQQAEYLRIFSENTPSNLEDAVTEGANHIPVPQILPPIPVNETSSSVDDASTHKNDFEVKNLLPEPDTHDTKVPAETTKDVRDNFSEVVEFEKKLVFLEDLKEFIPVELEFEKLDSPVTSQVSPIDKEEIKDTIVEKVKENSIVNPEIEIISAIEKDPVDSQSLEELRDEYVIEQVQSQTDSVEIESTEKSRQEQDFDLCSSPETIDDSQSHNQAHNSRLNSSGDHKFSSAVPTLLSQNVEPMEIEVVAALESETQDAEVDVEENTKSEEHFHVAIDRKSVTTSEDEEKLATLYTEWSDATSKVDTSKNKSLNEAEIKFICEIEDEHSEVINELPVVEEEMKKSSTWVTGTNDVTSPQSQGPVNTPSDTQKSEEVMTQLETDVVISNEVLPTSRSFEVKETAMNDSDPQTSVVTVDEDKNETATSLSKAANVLHGVGLVGYEYSSESEDESEAEKPPHDANLQLNNTYEINNLEFKGAGGVEGIGKEKAVSPTSSMLSNCHLLENDSKLGSGTLQGEKEALNPIVGETIEEELVLITGEGSGAELQGGNAAETDTESSAKPSNTTAPTASESGDGGDSSTEIEEAPVGKKGPGRPRGRKPGSGRTGRPRKPRGGGSGRNTQDIDRSSSAGSDMSIPGRPASIKKQVNGRLSGEVPTRQSSRIAKIQEREEIERRKLEEQRLAQLKAAQIKKQQRQQERDLKQQGKDTTETETPSPVKPRGKGRPPKTESKYLPTPSASDSEDDDLKSVIQISKKRGRKRKHNEPPKTLMKKGLNPWIHTSSEDEDEAVEEEEEFHDYHEEEEEDLTIHSDHEFSPESDLGEDDEAASPSRHARTVKRGEVEEDKYAQTNCDTCGKGDHPEWILLCDSCDKGYHASCLRPVIWVIPEGQWFCTPCQHKMLIEKLNENLEEYDKILKKHELEVMRKQRLAYVGISLDNVLPQQEGIGGKSTKKERKKKRRQISSEEEEDDLLLAGRGGKHDFIDEREDSSNISQYNSEDSEDEPMYKLRARKATKSFNFKEYDELINSALRDDDEYEVVDGGETAPELIPEGESVTDVGVEDTKDSVPPKLTMSKGKVMPNSPDMDETEGNVEEKPKAEEFSDEGEIDEVEKKRLEQLEKQSHRKTRRRLNDLDATSDEDSDEDFKGSDEDEEEDEAYGVEDEDSEWSGDREADESDDSIAKCGKAGKKGKFGRQEKYLDVGSVRRSTRRARSRIVYDESDQEDDEDEPAEGWGSEEESDVSSASESDDETWGRKRKKKALYNPPKSKLRKSTFVLTSPSKSKMSPKKKKKKADDDEVDRAWSKHGGKVKKGDPEPSNKRSTRGKKIDFKVILESGESDDDGNIHPKRKKPRLSDYENDSDGPSSSKKLVAELNAAQVKAAASAVKNSKKNSPPPAGNNRSNAKLNVDTSSSEDSASEDEFRISEQLLLKPVPAPPFPPKKLSVPAVVPLFPAVPVTETSITVNQRTETSSPVSANNTQADTPPPIPAAPPPMAVVSQPSTNLMMSEILATSGNKKQQPLIITRHPTPPPSSPGLPQVQVSPGTRTPLVTPSTGPVLFSGNVTPPQRGLSSPPHQAHALLPPSEISRVPNPAYYPPNQSLRFPWDRSLGPPPPPYQGRGPPPQPLGKPPPLNASPYPSSRGSPSRAGYVPPPPLRIPNPGVSGPPMQSFQQFKREPPGLGPQMMYRIPQGNGNRGGTPNILAHLQSSHERFFGPHGGFGGPPPYGIPPPHSQGPIYSTTQPQQFDYRPDDSGFKEDMSQPERRSLSPLPGVKEENKTDGEFGGLVSYFSSQRGEEDMDS